MNKHVPGTVVAVDFSSDDEVLVTVSVPVDTAWGYEAVTIVRNPQRKPNGGQLSAVREIVTEWNFGPLSSEHAIKAIFDVIGDDIQ